MKSISACFGGHQKYLNLFPNYCLPISTHPHAQLFLEDSAIVSQYVAHRIPQAFFTPQEKKFSCSEQMGRHSTKPAKLVESNEEIQPAF